MFIIGVAGQAQMGKDTVADYLQQKLNKGGVPDGVPSFPQEWHRAAFAANVKKVFCDAFGVDLAFIEEWKVKPEPPPGFKMPLRQALQFIGDGFRTIKETVWLDLLFRNNSSARIVSDVRYVNEFSRVKAEGGFNVLVGRTDRLSDDPNGSEAQIRPYVEWCLKQFPGQTFVRWPAKKAAGGPENMEMFDAFIRNDGTYDELYDVINKQLIPCVFDHVHFLAI